MTPREPASTWEAIKSKYEALRPVMNERMRRLWAAAEARSLGRGGATLVHRATGLAQNTIRAGIKELAEAQAAPLAPGRLRRPGAGRKPLTQSDPTLLEDLEALVEPVTRGDPESPLRWTCKSVQRLARELAQQGHRISGQTVSVLLRQLHYSLQANKKTQEGATHPDREAQFAYINERTKAAQQHAQPVISVDTKKKELIGNFKNGGREWRPKGEPEEVRVHDFLDKEMGKAIPYGVYDLTKNTGWVSVGCDHDTAEFAVATIARWWEQMGKPMYPEATELQIMADGGGSNSSRCRLWKVALQRFADATGLRVSVSHFPPGTSKWNKIEHRMFSFISLNWRGRPLISHEVIVSLIGSTTTGTGLSIQAALDPTPYPTRLQISDAEMAQVQFERHDFHGEWNYTILPRNQQLIL
jgi:Rhodopirellula transposase DDE domain